MPVQKNGQHTTIGTREVFLPFDKRDGTNPNIHLDQPSPGILLYRFSEGFNYLNATGQLEQLLQDVYDKTRKTNPGEARRKGDYSWNEFTSPFSTQEQNAADNRPLLKAIILDFSGVSNVDVTVSR